MFFSQLSKAQLFSEFDLKSKGGTLHIPKAMTHFQTILHTNLIYIDDILLFSSNKQEHETLLHQFLNIVQSHGIMLSEKEELYRSKQPLRFLGMKIIDGKYRPDKDIAKELLKFSEENLSIKEIQQFLGIVNYIRDFIRIARIY
ncbi:hypothetical protein DH2020_003881 [Rehmannia glutinosa]|uniref:Reverse transcriptase domain-containing protein n=1 Tax=Rehmannia glutinosa TaxID=99300 RepID=A0ABR0XMW3_REHGL